MFANVKRGREREMCVCVLFEFHQSVCFFYSGKSSTYFKVLCRSLQKKSDRMRCLAVSRIFLSTISDPKLLGPRYNINWNS